MSENVNPIAFCFNSRIKVMLDYKDIKRWFFAWGVALPDTKEEQLKCIMAVRPNCIRVDIFDSEGNGWSYVFNSLKAEGRSFYRKNGSNHYEHYGWHKTYRDEVLV